MWEELGDLPPFASAVSVLGVPGATQAGPSILSQNKGVIY